LPNWSQRADWHRSTARSRLTCSTSWLQAFTASGLRLLAFLEYDVEYAVRDIESLLFWLRGLDGSGAQSSATALNRVLAENVDERGFVTNEHRYLAVAATSTHGNRPNRLVPGASVRHNP
jgi:hypothetical protein